MCNKFSINIKFEFYSKIIIFSFPGDFSHLFIVPYVDFTSLEITIFVKRTLKIAIFDRILISRVEIKF